MAIDAHDAVTAGVFAPLQSGAEGWSSALSMAFGALFFIAVLVVIAKNRWNTPHLDPQHAALIISQLKTLGGEGGASVVVRDRVEMDDPDIIANIRGLFHGERSDGPRARDESVRLIQSFGGAIRSELSARKPSVSKVPERAVEVAVIDILFGAIVVLPVAWWQQATRSGANSAPSLGDVLSIFPAGLDLVITGVTGYPYADFFFAIGLMIGILGAKTIWKLFFVPPVLLLGLSGAYFYLERRVDSDRPVSGPSIRAWTRRFLTLTGIMWAVGFGLAAIGAAIPFRAATAGVLTVLVIGLYAYLDYDVETEQEPDADEDAERDPDWMTATDDDDGADEDPSFRARIGEELSSVGASLGTVNWKRALMWSAFPIGLAHPALALVVSFAFGGRVCWMWIRRTLARWKRAAGDHGRDALALDIIHSLTVTIAAFTLPLAVGYVIAAFWTQKIVEVGAIILAAPDSTVIAVAVLAIVSVLFAAVVFADAARDLRRGIRRALSVQAVRSALIVRAAPVVTILTVTVFGIAAGLPLEMVIVAALALGIVTRIGWAAYNSVSYRVHSYDGRDSSAARVVISGRKVYDAEDDPVYIADLNGYRIAHRDLDSLLSQIRRDTREYLRDGVPETGSLARYYYKNGVKRGRVDMSSVGAELLGDIRTRYEANAKQGNDEEKVMEKLRNNYPEKAVQQAVKRAKQSNRVRTRDGALEWSGD